MNFYVKPAAQKNNAAAANDQFLAHGNTPLVFDGSRLTANDLGDVTVISVDNAQNGVVSLDWRGLITFVPNEGFSGPTTFDYTVSDAEGNTSIATVTVDVAPVQQAAIERSGAEFQVNTTTVGGQFQPSTTVLANGNLLFTWTDTSRTGGDFADAVRGQIFDPQGNKIGSEFLVNTTVDDNENTPETTALSNGGFVVTWQDGGGDGDIRAQLFTVDDQGNAVKSGNEFVVNSVTDGTQDAPTVTALSGGRFVVTWEDLSGADSEIKGRIFTTDAQGHLIQSGDEFVVNKASVGDQFTPVITGLANGGFVVSWEDDSGADGDFAAVRARVFRADGTPLGDDILINNPTGREQDAPTITALAGGGFVVAWEDFSGQVGDDDSSGIVAQIFNDQGQKIGDQFLVNTTMTGAQVTPKITALADGKFVVIWDSYNNPTPDSQGNPTLMGQVFDANGNRVGNEFQINTAAENDRTFPSIAALPDGRFVVSWSDSSGQGADQDGFGVKAQIFSVTTTGADQAPTGETLTLDQALIDGKLPENSAVDTAVGTVKGLDPDAGDRLTYSLVNLDSNGQPIANGGALKIDTNTGAITVANSAALDFENATSHDVRVKVTDQAGLSFEKTFTINLSDVNEKPTITQFNFDHGDTIPENTANGTAVGRVIAADPDANEQLSYSLTNDANGAFKIDADGTVRVADSSKLDFENSSDHTRTIEVTVTDKDGLSDKKTVTINVFGVNEKPTITDFTFANGDTIAENTAADTVIGKISATDPDAGDSLSYSLSNDANGAFKIDADGTVRVADSSNLDFESSSDHTRTIEVTVTDKAGLTDIRSVTINLSDMNEKPTIQKLDGDTVAEDALQNTVVGTIVATDLDANDSLSYAIVDSQGNVITDGPFAIDNRGIVTVQHPDQLDFETNPTLTINVRVTDRDGLSDQKPFTISVTNVNEGPRGALLDNNTVAENSADGKLVGTVTGVDPEAGAVLTYSLVNLDSQGHEITSPDLAPFTIDPSTGNITVLHGNLLDFETANTHSVKVRVTDQTGKFFEKTLTIQLQDANEAPTAITLDNHPAAQGATVAEHTAAGTAFATALGIDPDRNETFTYTIINLDDQGNEIDPTQNPVPFTIDPKTGVISVADSSFLDANLHPTLSIKLKVTDHGNLVFETGAIPITVSNVNDPPVASDVVLSTNEDTVKSIKVADLLAAGHVSDPDEGDTVTLTAVTNATGGTVAITDGNVVFKPAANFSGVAGFDYSVKDNNGSVVTRHVTVDVAPVADTPTLLAGQVAAAHANGKGQFKVNPDLLSVGFRPSIALLSDGGFIVTYNDTSRRDDDPSDAIRGQRFDANGNLVDVTGNPVNPTDKLHGQFLVNTTISNNQDNSRVAALAGGGWAVVWEGTNGDGSGLAIKAQMFGADGKKIGETLVNSQSTNDQKDPAIAGLANGGFVVTWEDFGPQNANPDVKAQLFDANGQKVGPEILVNTITDGNQKFSSVAGLQGGGFVVVWEDNSTNAIKAQIFDVGGTKVASEFVVSTRQDFFHSLQGSPSVTPLKNGNFIVTWLDFSGLDGDPSSPAVKGRIVGADGSRIGEEFLVNTATPGGQSQQSITALANGDFVAVWVDPSGIGGDNSGGAIKAQVFSSNGVKIGGEFLVNTFTAGEQRDPIITAFGPNGFIVAWTDNAGNNGGGVQAQTFTLLNTDENTAQSISIVPASTDSDGSETLTTVVSGIPAGAILSDGHGHSSNGAASVDVTGWNLGSITVTPPQDFTGNFQLMVTTTATDSAVLSDGQTHTSTNPAQTTQTFNVIVTPPGTGSDAHVLGTTANPETLQGSAGNDLFIGGRGNDTLIGAGGNDTYLFGRGDGQDQIVNGATGQTPRGELDFNAGITNEQLWFQQSGNDLLIEVMGGQDRITVAGWFDPNATSQLNKITVAGSTLDNSSVAQLVQAMATYSGGNPGFDPTTATQAPNDDKLQQAIAAAWHA